MDSFISYLGGKSLLTRKILPKVPEHTCYVEVFAGAAWMLFRKDPSPVEIINDINTDLVTLYRVIQHHLDEFIRYFRWLLVSRDEFGRLKTTPPEILTDIQRAARFYYVLRNSYGGKIRNPSFNISPSRQPALNLLRIEEELSAAHLRLSRVYIENNSYERILQRYDRPTTFFYLDPPYMGCEKDYGKGIFSREDFGKLNDLLRGLKGKYIMSINDTPEIRKLYAGLRIERVSTSYATAKQGSKCVFELLIMNFKPGSKSL